MDLPVFMMNIVLRIQVPIATELMVKKDMSYLELMYGQYRLSDEALDVLNGAYNYLTGMLLGVNEYYLAESMTEAICCAEALGL